MRDPIESELEAESGGPDLVIERGSSPAVPPLARPAKAGGMPAEPPWAIPLVLGILFGPVAIAGLVRLLTNPDGWASLWPLWVAALALLMLAGWFLDRAQKRLLARANRPFWAGDREAETLLNALGLGTAVVAEVLLVGSFEPWAGIGLMGLFLAWIAFCAVTPARWITAPIVFEVVGCPPETVVAYVCDASHWPLYQTGVELLGPFDTPLHRGSIVRGRITRKIVLEADMQVTDLQPGRRLAITTLGTPYHNAGTYELEATARGTRVRYTYRSLQTISTMVFGDGFVKRELMANLAESQRDWTGRLKALLEGRPPASV